MVSLLPKEATMQELIEADTSTWKSDLLSKIFKEEEPETICNMPMSIFGTRDKIIWWPVRNDVFSVKSA